MPTNETYREANRRSHKLLGCYLALWAWCHKVDCAVLQRDELLPYLDLKKMQSDRIDKLKEDVKDFFPYARALYYAKIGVYATLYLSRVPFPPGTFSDTASDKRRIVRLQAHGIKVAEALIPKEDDIVVILAKLSSGVGELSEG